VDQLDKSLKELAKVVFNHEQTQNVLLNNQKALSEAYDGILDQYNVLARVVIMQLNQISQVVSAAFESDALNPIDYEHVRKAFLQYHDFKKRPDYKDHEQVWFLGEDLSTLPPPPSIPKEEEKDPTPAENGEGRIFGGDYAESDIRNETTEQEGPPNPGDCQEPEVPEVRNQNAPG
jgi:hypothetical protein